MPQSSLVNRRIVLRPRPVGVPTSDDFGVEVLALPEPRPADGQVLLRTLYLSLPMVGSTVCIVQASRHPDYTLHGLHGVARHRATAGRCAVFDAVMPLLNARARVPLCGLISPCNATAWPAGPDRLGLLASTLLRQRVRVQGFIVFADYGPRYAEFAGAMGTWVDEGKVKFREDIVHGQRLIRSRTHARQHPRSRQDST